MQVKYIKLNPSDTAKVKSSKIKVTRSNEIMHKNIKHMTQTSSDNGNIPVL